MPSSCTRCGKEFSRNVGLQKHMERKNPCKVPAQLIQANVNQALEEAGVAHLETPIGEFRETSKKFNFSLTKEERSEQGIFFTPKKVRDLLFTKLAELGVEPKTIIEPSFGSGEFLLDARGLYPDAEILGVEMNESLFASVKCPNSTLTCGDFLEWKGSGDLIIGNPPYFLMKTEGASVKEKKEVAAKHSVCMTGRPNMYIRFLHKCLDEHLAPDGFLAFIIPTSLYNCSYYQPMRNYIQQNTTIRYLETLDKPGFYETTQETMLIILQKNVPMETLLFRQTNGLAQNKTGDDYIFKSNSGNIYLSPFYKELYEITKGAKTISDLGLGVKTGNVVWNQVKENLSNEGTLLIYSSNINNSELKLDNIGGETKKQYVKDLTKPVQSGPVILVGRGYGNSFHFNSVLVRLKKFYAENHINVIYPVATSAKKNLKKVVKSFKDGRTLQFMKYFFGNGSISATELETIVPIF